MRLLYILSGQLHIRIGRRRYQLSEDGLLLINSYEMYSIEENGGIMAVFDLDLNGFDHSLVDRSKLWFDCNSATASQEDSFTTLKGLLARFIKLNVTSPQDNTLLNISFAYTILHHLSTFYRSDEAGRVIDDHAQLQRMEEIIRFVNQHYNRPLSLQEVAQHMFLSVPYTSKIFRQYFDTTFTDYLNSVRFGYAERELRGSQYSVEQLAERHGFPSTRSFIASFRKKYGVTPSQFRKQARNNRAVAKDAVSGNTDFVHQQNLGLLAQYLDQNDAQGEQSDQLPQKVVELAPCHTLQKGTRLRHTFKTLTSIGKAKHILFAENQAMLRQLQQAVCFEFIVFHGIFDDDMMVYGENENGALDLNFNYVDLAIDFLRSIKLKPFLELSFMPKALAQGNHTMYYQESNISLPNDMNRWCLLVEGLVTHLMNRYGAEEVASWPFALWNMPDSSMFGFGSVEAYFQFYLETWRTIKRCLPAARVGAPSILTETAEKGPFWGDFFELCQIKKCKPDFVQYHYFPVRLEQQHLLDVTLVEQHLIYRSSADAMRRSIGAVRNNMQACGVDVDTLYITEWNVSISHRELLTDTAFQAAYIVKNILENYDSVDSFCYWVLSDSIEEVRMSKELYHGGLGLFTFNGLPKASFYAFKLLAQLGDTLLAKGDGYFVTKSTDGFKVMLYNYHHFSELYANGELFDMTFTNRYTPFSNPTRKKYVLPLHGISASEVMVTEMILNHKHGSSFDRWLDLGALPLETQEDVDYIRSTAVPAVRKRILQSDNDTLTLSATLEPHEVRLITLREKA